MDRTSKPEELLDAASRDSAFLAALRANDADAELSALLSALEVGLAHPNAQDALDRIEEVLTESQDLVASYTASESNGAYPVNIYGFDHLCYVHAPEYGSTGPFPSHAAAMNYVEQNWCDLLDGNPPEVFKFAVETPRSVRQSPSKPSSQNTASDGEPLVLQRHRIGDFDYSKIGPESYRRHRKTFLDGDETLSTEQLIARLCKDSRVDDERLNRLLVAAGWGDVAQKVADRRRRIRSENAEAARHRKAAFTADVIAFIDAFLDGREDPDGKLVDAAALKWARGVHADHTPNDDESDLPNPVYARDRYYAALHAYHHAVGEAKNTKARTKKNQP